MDHSAHAGHPAPAIPQGLQVAEQGYRITPPFHTADAGTSRIEFTIVGPDGTPVTDFDERHDKRLHFIAAQRDTSVFHHLHPRMDAAGLWSVEVDLTPGVWRLFADFAPTGADTALTLGADLAVPGDFRPRPLPEPSATSTIDDYTVTLAGDLAAGRGTELRATVTRAGVPVTDLQPYLAAYGHLVALRAGDLAYLHIHPEGDPADPTTPAGPDIRFHAVAPSAGTYRLFLDFRHGGTVRTADFTLTVDDTPTEHTAAPPAPHHAGHGHHHH
ncbi:hypothetical protein GCM10010528_02470 [Gordonia defluvii]|uniref:Secreted protein n=1 Tax=Gordonia defluvii TaxID=283718 RepID=A0ABP6KYI0_9ACTN|nr:MULTISPECIES: hypothetical protein [Gordonia]